MKNIVTFFILLTLSFNSYAQNQTNKKHINLCTKYHFDDGQLNVLKLSYLYGKPFDLGYTLAAIAWQESVAGKYLINVNDPSFGVYHILISTAASRAKVRGLNKNLLAYNLMMNQKLAAAFAIKELLYWKTSLKRKEATYSNIWAAYNAGWHYNGRQGQRYSSNIQEKVRWMQKCFHFKSY